MSKLDCIISPQKLPLLAPPHVQHSMYAPVPEVYTFASFLILFTVLTLPSRFL